MRVLLAIALILAASFGSLAAPADKPNIVFILADDLGYGDIHALNPERCKIPTPTFDRLASESLVFTDAHGSAAICTPSRYGLLTGRYNWRSRLQKGVLVPYDPPLLAKDRLTLPEMLKQQGYDTACFGKWHLGWNWPGQGDKSDFTQAITGGPTEHGFDRYFGVDVPNYPPYCFISNDHTVGIPSVPLADRWVNRLLASDRGIALPGWDLEAILPTLTDKACDYIHEEATEKKPFFIYFALTSPHTPLAPTADWKGKSELGAYGDLVMETDAMVGRVLKTLSDSGIAQDTIVVLAGDNGCASYIGVPQMEAKGHFPSADRRGYKFDAWDGGHRVPLLVRWPGKTAPGSHCDQMVCLNDFMATFAAITGAKLPPNAAEDSVSLVPLLEGRNEPIREFQVYHSGQGHFAIRQGKWKLILGPGSDYSKPAPAGGSPILLYDMTQDVGERANLAGDHPEIVKDLTTALEKIIADGRTTPGPKQKNDVEVKIFEKIPGASVAKPLQTNSR